VTTEFAKEEPIIIQDRAPASITTDLRPQVDFSYQEEETAPLAWLTIEVALYGLIIAVAIALRLWQLEAIPLATVEVPHAWSAWQLYHGDLPTSTNYSPLLVTGNLFSFFLFGDSDSSARLPNVMLGMVLVLLPLTLRRQFGVKVCLILSALLTISPITVYLSRTINSDLGVAVGSLMLVAGFFNWAAQPHTRWLLLLAVGLATLLTAGPMSLSVIVVFGLLIAVGLGVFFKWSASEALEWAKELATTTSTPQDLDKSAPQTNLSTSVWQQFGLYFVAILAVLATTAGLNFSGLGSVTTFLNSWLSYFSLQTQLNSGYNAVLLLALYDPLIFMFGLVGLGYAMVRSDLLGLALGGWFVGLLLFDVLMGGRPNGAVVLPLIPLAILASFVLAELWDGIERQGKLQNEGVLVAIGAIIATFGYIGLMGWVERVCAVDDQLCENAWLQPIAAFVLFLVVALFFFVMNNLGVAVRGMGLTFLLVGLLLSVNNLARLNYGPLKDVAYQPLANISPTANFGQLMDTIRRQSVEKNLDTNLMDIMLVGSVDSILQWQFRNFPNLTTASAITETPTNQAIITPIIPGESPTAPGETYIGQSFEMQAVWSPINLSNKDLISWYFYRTAKDRPQSNQLVLWLRM